MACLKTTYTYIIYVLSNQHLCSAVLVVYWLAEIFVYYAYDTIMLYSCVLTKLRVIKKLLIRWVQHMSCLQVFIQQEHDKCLQMRWVPYSFNWQFLNYLQLSECA